MGLSNILAVILHKRLRNNTLIDIQKQAFYW
jgi:hypothetical protein